MTEPITWKDIDALASRDLTEAGPRGSEDQITWSDIDVIQAQTELQQARVSKRQPRASAVELLEAAAEADAALLRTVGLPAEVALKSARAVQDGIYGSLQEAADHALMWGRTERLDTALLERLLRERSAT